MFIEVALEDLLRTTTTESACTYFAFVSACFLPPYYKFVCATLPVNTWWKLCTCIYYINTAGAQLIHFDWRGMSNQVYHWELENFNQLWGHNVFNITEYKISTLYHGVGNKQSKGCTHPPQKNIRHLNLDIYRCDLVCHA